ncbi:MAG: hemerythrin domain-containing protein [Elusimicrobiales bacterium]|jgi:hemerythrin-like domain-containing protein
MTTSVSKKKMVSAAVSAAEYLMMEHRLIERMIRILAKESVAGQGPAHITIGLPDAALEFFQVYVGLCHYGKEEGILLRELRRKPLRAEDLNALEELAKDHLEGRRLVAELSSAAKLYKTGLRGAAPVLLDAVKAVCRSYRAQIEKEDKRFLPSAAGYFSPEEESRLLEEFRKFDSVVLKETYTCMVASFE